MRLVLSLCFSILECGQGYYNTEFPRFFLEQHIIESLVKYRSCPCIAVAHQRLDFHSMNFEGASLLAPYLVASKLLSRTSFVKQVMDFSKVGLDKSVFEITKSTPACCGSVILQENSKKVQAEKEKILLFLQVFKVYLIF